MGKVFRGEYSKILMSPPPPITVKPPIFGVLEKQGDNGGTVFGVPLFEGPVFWVLEKRGKNGGTVFEGPVFGAFSRSPFISQK